MKIPKDKLPVITNEMFVSWCNLYNHLYNDLDQHGETLLEDMVKHFEKQIIFWREARHIRLLNVD